MKSQLITLFNPFVDNVEIEDTDDPYYNRWITYTCKCDRLRLSKKNYHEMTEKVRMKLTFDIRLFACNIILRELIKQ